MDVAIFYLYSKQKYFFTFSTSRLVCFSCHLNVASSEMNKKLDIQMKKKLCFHMTAMQKFPWNFVACAQTFATLKCILRETFFLLIF